MAGTLKVISRNSIRRVSGNVAFGDVIYPPSGTFGPRIQLDYQIFILNSGSLILQIEDSKQEIKPGEVCLLKPGNHEFFQFSKLQPSHHQWCSVSPQIIPPQLKRHVDKSSSIQSLTRTLRTIVEIGLSTISTEKSEEKTFLDQLGLCALGAFALGDVDGGEDSHQHSALRRARAYIHGNLAEPFRLPDLARTAGVSPSHLIRLFKDHLGITPSRYIWNARVEKATEWLRDSGLSIGEISDQIGFQNQFHLSRLFKKYHKCTPSEYRNKSWDVFNKGHKT